MATTTKTSTYEFFEFPNQSEAEELANTLTHGMGLVLSITGSAALLGFAVRQGMAGDQFFATMLYCLSLIAVYAASTFSHALQEPHRKYLFRVLDQAVIYCLIAGTYTPFIFLYLPARQSWLVFAIVWGLALLGFGSKVLLKHRVDAVVVANYVLLGWVPAVAIFYLLPFDCLMWMLLGGCLYTAGALFLTFDQRVPFFHAAWHAFVLLASAVHFYGVLHYTVV
ncbi:MAG: PAQR family membrane homeostasis protein TrhA [Planctomycetota bacterium]